MSALEFPLIGARRAALRLSLAVAVSAALHAAALLAVRVAEVERPGRLPVRLSVRLAEVAPPAAPDPEPAPPLAATAPLPEPAAPAPPQTVPEPAEAPQNGEGEAREGMPEAAAGPATLDLPLPPDPTYYPARLVDEHPVLVSGGKPVYPEEAARRDIRGEVIVLMLLNEHGRADEVSIVEAKPAGLGFEEAVIAWLRDARFRPAMRQGRAVKARVVYHVTFEP